MRTKHINTNLATPGMVVAEDIYSFSDQLIIGIDTELTDRIITRLKFYSVREITIYDPEDSYEPEEIGPATFSHPSEPQEIEFRRKHDYIFRLDPPATPIPEQEPYSTRVKHSEEFKHFSRAFSSSILSYRSKINAAAENIFTLDVESMLSDVHRVVDACSNHTSLFDMLMCIRELDDVTYVHGLNVALITNVFASWLKLSKKEIDELTLAGLLHDIGKIKVPKIILTKPAPLSTEEFTEVKAHSLYGYNLLKNTSLPDGVKYAALMHHERCDGTGYPMGLHADKIHMYAKIIAITDVYDAMTAARVYRGPICPIEVIEIFESEGLQKYDPHFIFPFIHGIIDTYLHHTVTLSTGQSGEIILINKAAISRPVIHLTDGSYLDLSKNLSISITGML